MIVISQLLRISAALRFASDGASFLTFLASFVFVNRFAGFDSLVKSYKLVKTCKGDFGD